VTRSLVPTRLFAALLALVLVACSGGPIPSPSVGAGPTAAPSRSAPSVEPSASGPAFPVILTDDEGTSVTIPSEPEAVVSLTPAETEILFALGAGDSVVGKVQDLANYPPEAADVPVVGTFDGVEAEKIVGAGADLVIAGGSGGTPAEAIDRLRSLGVPVLVVYAATTEDVFADIELTGAAVGRSAEAAALVEWMRAGFKDVASATAGARRPRVFYETGDQPAIYGIADDSVYAEMIELAGGTPITTGSATSWEMPVEDLISADPELIILGDAAYGVTEEAVASRPGWDATTAVKTGAIEPIDDILVTRPGPRLVEGLRLLAEAIHPEIALPPLAPPPPGG
jgi:iron complex transport system substrate-binding protein